MHNLLAGANYTCNIVPEFLAGGTTQHRETLQRQGSAHEVPLIVGLVSTTIITFDGKSGKIEIFEYLFFYTAVKMQRKITETVQKNYFNSVLQKRTINIVEHNYSKIGKS